VKNTDHLISTEDGGICHKDTSASFGIHTFVGGTSGQGRKLLKQAAM